MYLVREVVKLRVCSLSEVQKNLSDCMGWENEKKLGWVQLPRHSIKPCRESLPQCRQGGGEEGGAEDGVEFYYNITIIFSEKLFHSEVRWGDVPLLP